jgi:transglutaminase-like putative cysteine protease
MRRFGIVIGIAAVVGCKSSETAAEPVKAAEVAPRKSRSFEFVYEAALEQVPAGAKQVRMWVPVPIDTPDQKISNLRIEASHPTHVASIEGGTGKSVCVESQGEPVRVRATFTCTRYETHGGGQAAEDELARALEPDRYIPLDGRVAAVAAAMETQPDAYDEGRELYWHTLERMKYDKPEGGQWGRGDAEWACDARFGNCTDFHSYFIGLARAKHIPARFEMGFSVPGGNEPVAKISGYHCWAYFWSGKHGWVPVDISEADKDASKATYFFGTLDENRVTMTGGRDVLLEPRPACGALNFFVYPYAEVDGAEVKNTTRSFSRANLAAK